MAFSENFRAKRENDFGIENALAGYCRRRWPDKPIQHIQQAWGLSESEASNALYGHASKRTLNKILHHKRGGPFLFCELVADVCGVTVEDIIKSEAERIAREAEEQRKTASRIYSLSRRLGSLNPVSDPGNSVSDFPLRRPGSDAPAWLADEHD